MALAAGALLAGLAVPAHAAGVVGVAKPIRIPSTLLPGQTSEARCSVHGDGNLFAFPPDTIGYDFEFTGIGSVHTQIGAYADDTVEFEAIFDRTAHSDPRCFVYTPRI